MPSEADRYIFRTRGVCPPEIHFQIQEGVLTELNFRGGGCPGNAQLVSRLIRGRPVKEIRPFLKDIPCQNNTSCPDQLDRALEAVQQGRLLPARSFQIAADLWPKDRLALVGGLKGQLPVWEALEAAIKGEKVKDVYCVGGLTDPQADNRPVLQGIRRAKKVQAVMSEQDWVLSQAIESGDEAPLAAEDRDYLASLPQVLSFQMDGVPGMAFFGRYLQALPGYSDYEPFALEMNLVSNLAQFMEDTSVFPALEAMTPQFGAKVVLFGQTTRWGHWQVGGVDFIAAGPAAEKDRIRWGLLTVSGGRVNLEIREQSRTQKGNHGQ